MRNFLSYLPLVGCLAMVLFMCGPMMFRRNKHSLSAEEQATTSSSNEIAELREEVSLLKAQIALKDDSAEKLS
ncbi:MAG: hypothetical protein ACR2M4_09120 [Actinomycetota bacterium]